MGTVCEDFEDGDTAGWTLIQGTGDTVTVSGDEPHTGVWGLKTYTNNSIASDYACIYKAVPASYEYWVRFYVLFKQLPNSNGESIRLLQLTSSDYSVMGGVTATYDGVTVKWAAYTLLPDWNLQYAATGPAIDVQYEVECRVLQSNAAGRVEVYVNSIKVAELTGIDTWEGTFLDRFYIGQVSTIVNEACTTYFDDICYSSTQIGGMTTSTSTSTSSTSTSTTSTSTTSTSTSSTSTSTTSTSTSSTSTTSTSSTSTSSTSTTSTSTTSTTTEPPLAPTGIMPLWICLELQEIGIIIQLVEIICPEDDP